MNEDVAAEEPTVVPVGDTVAEFGEGPCWDRDTGTLLWVDIPAGAIHRTDPDTGRTTTREVPAPVSMVLPETGNSLLIAARHQLLALHENGALHEICALELDEAVRFNDGKRDPDGRLWVGTMHTAKLSGQAALYRLDNDTLTSMVPNVAISNGLGWSPSGETFYYVDTPTRRIDAFDYDRADAALTRRRTFADLTDTEGRPDGLTVAPDGTIWVALIRGGKVHCYGPDGVLRRVLRLPVSHPTSCAFDGTGSDLYVTTAREPLAADELAAQSLAGRLLRIPGAAGPV